MLQLALIAFFNVDVDAYHFIYHLWPCCCQHNKLL